MSPWLDALHFIARAVTPPRSNRRFDTRFLMIYAEHIQDEVHARPHGSGELLDLRWVPLSQAQRLDQTPLVTQVVLQELERRLREGVCPEESGPFLYTHYVKPIRESI